MSTYSLTFRRDTVNGDTDFLTNITDSAVLNDVFGSGHSASTTTEFVFDRNVGRSTKINVSIAKFGDGYEQRVRNGINPKTETFNVSFKAKTNNETKVLTAFFDNKTGANFDIVINGETIKAACEAYSVTYAQDNAHNVQTQLRRVYEP